AGPTTTDGCSAITNASAIAGRIALIDRGTCGFTVKVKNAQNAGATAVLIADNAAGSPPAGLGGADATITIPSARITLDAGNAIKAALTSGAVNGLLAANPAVIQGADAAGHVMLYSPLPSVSGSSTSHYDISAFRNLLMEPNINLDLTHEVVPPNDLTLPLLRDIGWYADRDLDNVPDDTDQCLGSDLRTSIIIAGCDTGVPNPLAANGCTTADRINKIAAAAKNHGDFVSGVTALTTDLMKSGAINGAQKGTIQSCAANAQLP
ncbi:MAG TPA: PA domain-containing protein, partial [Thermoanaerobaculia bacterium]|nr:PA domain-containing protein [Thermoanaerobaculia bacterium]